MQQEINIKVGNKAPADYFGSIVEQCSGGPMVYGAIDTNEELKSNLEPNPVASHPCPDQTLCGHLQLHLDTLDTHQPAIA